MSIGRETWVYERPTYESRRLGYLRFGAKVKRDTKAAGTTSCAGGWYRIAPEGYVCSNGRTATTDPNHPLAKLSIRGPVRESALPYDYGLARKGIPIFHRQLSTTVEQDEGLAASIPAWFRQLPEIHGFPLPEDGSRQVAGLAGSGVAFTERYVSKAGAYRLTPNLELVAQGVFERVEPSAFVGLPLDEKTTLPVAFVRSKSGFLYRSAPNGAPSTPLRPLAYREAIPIETGLSPRSWVKTTDGAYLRRDQVTIIDAPTTVPTWVKGDQVWIDVSIEQQALVAYVGKTAKYVTLVSTGVDGLSDPLTSKATKQGIFSIVSKHVTATMDGQDEERAYEMREVPWVQYFSEGYALHAAYWHDAFGQPKSHGCVNLSPRDARWLFHFTNPGVPVGWHGRTVERDAATVYVH
jgi:lipoprotein-anchoring transpeptidase ErfK/SrfK